jgi:hypothetical protein
MERQQIIDAIRDQWIKDYGSIEDGQDRNGYFVIGFVDSVLKRLEKDGRNNEMVRCNGCNWITIDYKIRKCLKCKKYESME